ncbi:MAG: hypothetical protein BRC29_01080 [Nanohaloarchaea archaeon SW_7_43_1]|nr:MAG: hypothetical protein BRC29_01080 [Nanohaloarchaea archaeon SW_7_43_1]
MKTFKHKLREKTNSSLEYITAEKILEGEVETKEDLIYEEDITRKTSSVIQYDEDTDELYIDGEEVLSDE